MNNSTIYTGCSSYNTKAWKGLFYPEDIPVHKWFDYYAEHFNTYELNGTFYKFPTAKSLKTWYNKVPPGYRFSVKAPKLITHLKRFNDCSREIDDFYTACSEGLADKLACVLFQLPPSFTFTQERLELITGVLNPHFKNVVEFRNESWWRQEVYDAFSAKDITFCGVDYPKLPNGVIPTNSVAYYRFHGNPKLFYSQYELGELEKVYQSIRNEQQFKEAYIYFNNTASEAGILNALEMKHFPER